MEKSTFISTIRVNDPRTPGDIIVLDIHQVEGGVIGISCDYTDEVANYIWNPYEGCQLVKITDPLGNDDIADPPLIDDETFGFLKILKAFDDNCNAMKNEEDRNLVLDDIAMVAGLSRDRVDVLLGMARETLEKAALVEPTKELEDDSGK